MIHSLIHWFDDSFSVTNEKRQNAAKTALLQNAAAAATAVSGNITYETVLPPQ